MKTIHLLLLLVNIKFLFQYVESKDKETNLRRRLQSYSDYLPIRQHKYLGYDNKVEHLEKEIQRLKSFLDEQEKKSHHDSPSSSSMKYQKEYVPLHQASIEQAPIEQAPIEQAPILQESIHSIEQAPIEQAPIEQAPILQESIHSIKQAPMEAESFVMQEPPPPPPPPMITESTFDASRLCSQNPYIETLDDPLEEIARKADKWLLHETEIQKELIKRSDGEHNHIRFQAFQELTTCRYDCVGGSCTGDATKIVCGLDALSEEEDCIIYSIGSNNKFDFELDVLERTHCIVHTFDCTGPRERFHVPSHERLHFHHVCIGAEYIPAPELSAPPMQEEITRHNKYKRYGPVMTLHEVQTKLNHAQIHLLKADIEGYEWSIMEAWPELHEENSHNYILPHQIVFELHYHTEMKDLAPSWKRPFKFEEDFIKFSSHLLKVGYAPVIRADNRYCAHCSELTLVRFRCHDN